MNALDSVISFIDPVLKANEVELADIELKRGGKNWILRIFIDKTGGVNLEDCQRVSTQVEQVLDTENVIEHAYILEVSSPGLDRPLKKKGDFLRNKDNWVKFYTDILFGNKKEFVAKVLEVKEDSLIVVMKKGEQIEIPFAHIRKALVEIDFK